MVRTSSILRALRGWLSPRYHSPAAWSVLAISAIVTYAAWHIANSFVLQNAEERFRFETNDIRSAIEKRMQDQEIILSSGVALFAVEGDVSREQWRDYVSSLEIETYFPGLQGYGFSRVIKPENLKQHIEEVRAEGFPDFTVKPEGKREIYTSIDYLEPFDWRNQRAFGYDMFSNPIRRAAMELARDTGNPAVSGAVTLVQETKNDVQRGFLMYLPVYRSGQPTSTVEMRRSALIGYVYSPFRVNDLMEGILGAGKKHLQYEIYDGDPARTENLLYQSKGLSSGEGTEDALMKRLLRLTTGGREWVLSFTATSGAIPQAERAQPYFVAAGGVLIDLLVFMVVGSLSRQRQRALALAQAMTLEIRTQSARTEAILENMIDSVVTIDGDGRILSFNSSGAETFGLRTEDCGRRRIDEIAPRLFERDADHCAISEIISQEDMQDSEFHTETCGKNLRNGADFPIDLSISVIREGGTTISVLLMRDISKRKAAEAEREKLIGQLQRSNKELDNFAYIAAHDLKEPLRATHNHCTFLMEDYEDKLDQDGVRRLKRLQSLSKRMETLTSDLMYYSRLGREDMAIREVDMNSVVEDIADTMSDYLKDNNAVINTPAPLPRMVCDSVRITELLRNLVVNAVRYNDNDFKTIEIGCLYAGETVLYVKDNGIGIAEEFHDDVFRIFKRLNSEKLYGEGSGAGLTFVKKIVEQHGGAIWIESAPDEGATFFFTLEERKAA